MVCLGFEPSMEGQMNLYGGTPFKNILGYQ